MIVFRIKWHWIAGGAFAAVFVLLLTFRVDLFGEQAERVVPLHADARVFLDREGWMSIFQEGQKIGYAHRRFFRTHEGYRFVESVFMRINTMGIVQGISFKTEGELHPDMSLSSFNFHLSDGSEINSHFSNGGTQFGAILSAQKWTHVRLRFFIRN